MNIHSGNFIHKSNTYENYMAVKVFRFYSKQTYKEMMLHLDSLYIDENNNIALL